MSVHKDFVWCDAVGCHAWCLNDRDRRLSHGWASAGVDVHLCSKHEGGVAVKLYPNEARR